MQQTSIGRIRTDWERADPRFTVDGDAWVEILFDQGRWVEGPAYSKAWRCLLFSDIPNDRVLRWDELTGAVGVWKQPAGFANGRTICADGRVVSCEQVGRAVTRVEHDGTTTVLAERWQGRRLNSPNDVVEKSDGTIWFTDPSYGIDGSYEGVPADAEVEGCHVYRLDPDGHLERVVTDMVRPNGLAFSLDERQLFIVDTRRKHIRVFDVAADNGLTGGEVIAECDRGSFDGIRLDEEGRLWAATWEGVSCYHPDRSFLGSLRLPMPCSNLTFGGQRGNMLFVTSTSHVYSLMVTTRGAA